jgi:hypothetical protein
MANIYIYNSLADITEISYRIIFIATNQDNGDLLHVVEGDLQQFISDNPDFQEYYEATWFQNFYPDAPGDTPLEKYLNALTQEMSPNPPRWSNILPAIASNQNLFSKLLGATDYNAFSALQTVINYRSLELFQQLLAKVITSLPIELSEEELAELNEILTSNNFPPYSEPTESNVVETDTMELEVTEEF